MTNIEGIITGLSLTKATGWVRETGDNLKREDFPSITIVNRGKVIAEGVANIRRPDLETNGGLGFGFSLTLTQALNTLEQPFDIKATATYKTVTIPLKEHKDVSQTLKEQAIPSTSPETIASSAQTPIVRVTPRQPKPSRKLCVVTYANDHKGWFPYFYAYYSQLVGATAIYVVTPKPELFSEYPLGGTITCSDMLFDNLARAELQSCLASGLQSYYEWSLVCDIDEIIVPHPNSGLDFFETLDKQTQHTLVSRGIDIIQMPGESDFAFDQPILKQRHVGIPNSALSKPHISRIPVHYGIGFHYCNHKLSLPDPDTGFLTLHLKHACYRVRNEISSIVANTQYFSDMTANYAAKSVSDQTFESRLAMYLKKPIQTLNSPMMQEFEASYSQNLTLGQDGLWHGKHIAAKFLVRILGAD